MINDTRGTLVMLDSSLRDLPPPAPAAGTTQTTPLPRLRTDVPHGAAPGSPPTPNGAADGAKKGYKKERQAKHRAEVKAELTGLADALRQLRGRVSDLHALQLERDGQGAGLATRLEALSAEQARSRGATAALDERVEALRAKVDALRAEAAVITDTLADLAVQPDRDTALFALEDRIQEAEDNLAGLQDLAGQGAEAMSERLDLFGRDLDSQGERLARIEGRLAPDAGDNLSLGRLEQSVGVLGTSVDDQLAGLERDIATLRDQNKRWREGERGWAEARLSGLRRSLAGGIALVALLLLAGFAATWWHGERQLDLIAARMAAVEQGTGERLTALAMPSIAADERLAAALDQLGAAMQGARVTTADLDARIAALPAPAPAASEAMMADLLARLRVLEESRSAGSAPEPVPGPGPAEAINQAPPDAMPQIPAGSAAAAQGQAPAEQSQAEQSQAGASQPVSSTPREQEAGLLLDAAEGAKAETLPIAESPPVVALGQVPAAVPDGSDSAASAPPGPEEDIGAAAKERYALQLIGFRTQTSIGPFARQHGISEDLRWLRTRARGRDWYVVLYGDYETREEAMTALADLPSGLRSMSPLVRTVPAGAQPMVSE